MSKEVTGGNRPQVHHPQEESFVSATWRAQAYAEGMPEQRGGLEQSETAMEGLEPTKPTVMREVAFSAQDADGSPAYTNPPGESMERGGDAPGGVARYPAGGDIPDGGRDPVPGDPPEDVHIVDTPGVFRANGEPDLEDGSSTDDSWREGIYEHPGDRRLQIKRDGDWEDVLVHTQDDTTELRGETLRGGTMKWKGEWAPGTYEKDDVVRDGDWLMIANKETTDRPAPEPVGSPEWTVPDSPSWVVNPYTGGVLFGLNIHDLPAPYEIESTRVWIEDTAADASYRLFIVDVTTGDEEEIATFAGDVLGGPGWHEVPFTKKLVTTDNVALRVEITKTSETQYVDLVDHYLPTAYLTGELTLSATALAAADDAHGVDAQMQEYSSSPDWDVLALSGSDGGGGGGGVDTFLALLDTPSSYSGNAQRLPRVNDPETGLEFVELGPDDVGADPAGSAQAVQDDLDAHAADSTIHYLDAPADGKTYGRKDTAWEEVTGGGGVTDFLGLTDTPTEYLDHAGDFVAVNGDEDALIFRPAPPGVVTYKWRFSTDTAETDPGAGHVKINDADPTLVTEVYIAQTDLNGKDRGIVIDSLGPGDYVAISRIGHPEFATYVASGHPTDNGTWWTIPVTYRRSNGVIPNNRRVYVSFAHATFREFTELLDTPSSYAGQAKLLPRVNTAEDALEFIALGPGDVGADPAGSAQAVQDALDLHEGDTGNPHAVTAAQAGADPVGSAQAVQDDLDTHKGDASIHYADAPADGKQYAREDNGWSEVAGGGAPSFVRYQRAPTTLLYSDPWPDGSWIDLSVQPVTDAGLVLDPAKSYRVSVRLVGCYWQRVGGSVSNVKLRIIDSFNMEAARTEFDVPGTEIYYPPTTLERVTVVSGVSEIPAADIKFQAGGDGTGTGLLFAGYIVEALEVAP